jgi:uncharacterized membrane protein (Fun14 family)
LRVLTARQLAVVLCGVVVGTVLGAMAHSMLDRESRLVTASVGVITLALIAVVGALTSHRKSLQETQQEILRQTMALAAGTSRSSSALIDELGSTTQQLIASHEELRRQVGLQVEYQLVRDLNTRETIEGDIVVRSLTNAKSEVLVLDYLSPSGRRPDRSIRPDLMEAHLRVLANHVRHGGITYKRLCQVDDVSSPFRGVADQAFVDHCREMYRMREEVGARVSLKVTRRRYPYKFLIIDHQVMIVQLHYLTDENEPVIWCELLVTDPQRDFVRVFYEIWSDMDDDTETRAVSRAEINGLEDASHTIRLE